jgi:EpsI family protein
MSNGTQSVHLDRLVYRSQEQGAELIGYGSRIATDSALVVERTVGPVGARRRLVNEAIVRDGEGHRLVWYWYRVGGVETSQPFRAKLLEVWAFFSRATQSELIAFSAPCAGASCEGAFQALSGYFGPSSAP